jgi:hypothetical protein
MGRDKVPEGEDEGALLVVDNEGTTPLHAAPVPHLTLTATDLAGILDLFDIVESVELLEEGDGVLGLGDVLEGLGGDDEGDLGDLGDLVTAGHDEGGHGRGSEGRAEGEPLLVDVDLAVPLPVGLGGGEHATSSAHVTEGTLACPVGTTTRHAGDTRDGATSTPRLGRRLHTGTAGHGVSLAAVLGEGRVDLLNHIGADGRDEHRGEDDVDGSAFTTANLNEGTRGLRKSAVSVLNSCDLGRDELR